MKSSPFETPPGDVDPRQAPSRFLLSACHHQMLRYSGTPVFRTQEARDFACLLDIDPNVLNWTCVGVELSYGGESYLSDFVVTRP